MRSFRLWWIFPNKFLIKNEEFNKNRILLASITASAVARCASSSVSKARGAIIEFALVNKLPDANFLDYRATMRRRVQPVGAREILPTTLPQNSKIK